MKWMLQTNYFLIALFFMFSSFAVMADKKAAEIKWSDLIPENYDPETLLEKYEDDIRKLNELPDNSEEGLAILDKLQNIIANAPVNEKMNGKAISLAGYIAPLGIKNGTVNRFLLVPYFGACIHVPAPPTNQTVLIETAAGHGIKLHQVDFPFMITGTLTLQQIKTDIGSAGYQILNAQVKPYKDEMWLE